MIKAVIFDFDDTLCMTEEACFEIENVTLEAMDRPRMTREIHRSTWGKPLFEVIGERSPGIDVEAFRQAYTPLVKQYFKEGKYDSISAENLRALEQLAQAGKTLLILTSRDHDELEHILHPDHVLANHIETFYHKDNMQYHKPDPRAFEHIERAHGWKPGERAYVGDSVGDAVSATGAGLHFIATLESGLRTREDFADYPVDAFIQTFPEVVDAVAALDSRMSS